MSDDGGPAFPVPENREHAGMSLREWYAGMAMPAVLAYYANETTANCVADDAFAYADAMIAHSKKDTK